MNRTGIQHASIAAEAINGLNHSDLTRSKDAYEVVISLKLLAQRLTLASTETEQLVRAWYEAGRLRTSPSVSTEATIAEFSEAMAQADQAALALSFAYEAAGKALAHVGWNEESQP